MSDTEFAALWKATAKRLVREVREVDAVDSALRQAIMTIARQRDEAIRRAGEAEAARDEHLAARLNAVDYRAVVHDIRVLLDTASDERGVTWWKWIEDGLSEDLSDALRAILARVSDSREVQP